MLPRDVNIETERLRLREVTIEDAPFILALLNDPLWLQYIGDRNIRTVEQAEEYIRTRIMKDYVEKGFGMFLVATKQENASITIGTCGLVQRDWLDVLDIGFAFLSQHCGKGYGYEAASAVLQYAEKNLNIDKLGAITDIENVASQKLLEKLGFSFLRNIAFENTDEEVMYFEN